MIHQTLRRQLIPHWPQILLVARGTVAALAALAVAVVLKLECPYWAAMTALIVIQPTRGLLLEKSYFRLIGTAVGLFAGLTMLLASRSPLMITILLCFWLAACVGIGNLLYGLPSYGAMVAGCTGAVIAMAGNNNPPHLHELVFGRIACIVIGIVVSTTVTLFFTQHGSKRELLDRLARVVGAELEWLALLVRGGERKELLALRQDVLMEIAEIEGSLDSLWAGSLDLRKRKHRVRSLIVSVLSLLEAGTLAGDRLLTHGSDSDCWREPFARNLEKAARHLHGHGSSGQEAAELAALPVELVTHVPLLGETLGETITSLQALINQWDATAPSTERPTTNRFIRHRDWQEAGRAALRAAAAIAAVGMTWHFTAWTAGPLMMMAASIMVSIFSTHDRPAVMLGYIFCGASLGVAAAFFCRLVLLPGVSDPLLQGAVTIPVLMAGIIALHHRRTALGAMDAMLFFLFVMQPGVAAIPAPGSYVTGGLACLGGIGVAILSFRFLLPVDPARRLRSLLLAIVRDLYSMATSDSLSVVEKCRVRTHHRVLRMLINARKVDGDLSAIVEGGLAALAIGRCLQLLREAERNEGINAASRDALREARFKLSAVIKQPEEILSVLEDVSIMLCRAMETTNEACNPNAQAVMPSAPETQHFALQMLFVGGKERQCHS